MGDCIICDTSVDGRICDSHEEDVVFDFHGNSPDELVSNRFYSGVVDGYADFGVFIDLSSNVTGLLHRSELDRRLESLDWEPGDTVFVQVTNVRDNGNIDLAWSIRQSEREFRGSLVHEDGTTRLPDDDSDSDSESNDEAEADTSTDAHTPSEPDTASDSAPESETNTSSEPDTASDSASESEPEAAGDAQHRSKSQGNSAHADTESIADAESDGFATETAAESSTETAGTRETAETAESADSVSVSTTESQTSETEPDSESSDETDFEFDVEPTDDDERVQVTSLEDHVDETIRIEGEIESARQTGGPTVFELRDESGTVDCAAFVEPGVRAYPEIDVGDIVRLEGEVEIRRDELQVETDDLIPLEDEQADVVTQRLTSALTDRARPDDVVSLADDPTVRTLSERLLDAAEAIRRAVFEERPIVVRHPASTDGYVAGAAVERAVLPLIRQEHSKSDAEYHYFTRRPIEESVYDMDDATNDVSRMLQNRDRHDEKLPLFLLIGTGSTTESADGLSLLDLYDAERVVVDAAVADPEIKDSVDVLASPQLVNTDGNLSTGALGANLAANVNTETVDEIKHLPAISYWESPPESYTQLAEDAGYDSERVLELREAIALEAYHQSYQDKRELITDLLFEDEGDLAGHVSEQFREKLGHEIDTAASNLQRQEIDGVGTAVLDTDAFTHRYDFPPKTLLLDELHRSEQHTDPVTLGVGTDELYLRSTADIDIREVADTAGDSAPDADLEVADIRAGRIEFLSGERDAAEMAVINATADLL